MESIPPRAGGAPATLKQVAGVAGVSRATASRVFTESPRVSARARRAVERAARQLGYVPNRAARSLRTGRTGLVALVIPEPTARLFSDPLFPRVVRGITEVLAEQDRQLVLLAPQSPADEERLGAYLAAGHVDGALLISLHGGDALPGQLAGRGLPVVVGGRPPVAAVGHRVARGRRRIATVTGPLDMPAAQDRLEGCRRALAAAGLHLRPPLEAEGDFSHDGGVAAMRALLARHPDLDAVFAASDLMAAGALQVLREAGRRVPEDVAVIGFDDSPFAASTMPPLSSVRQPIEEWGREMTRVLGAGIDAERQVPRRVILATEMVVRASTG
jgi:DNA-binding LacI/PurR family transcriptional regulator